MTLDLKERDGKLAVYVYRSGRRRYLGTYPKKQEYMLLVEASTSLSPGDVVCTSYGEFHCLRGRPGEMN